MQLRPESTRAEERRFPRPLAPLRTSGCSQADVVAYVRDGWRLTDALFDAIVDERLWTAQPDPLRNPLIFYLGHPAAFFINKLRLAGLLADPLHAQWDALFAVGVDPDRAGELDVADRWPSVREVRGYRARALDAVLAAVARCPWDRPLGWDDPAWAVLMACEHERIHFETSSVLLRQAPVAALERPAGWTYALQSAVAPAPTAVAVAGGEVHLGRPSDADAFGWDNEYGDLQVEVAPFEARRDLVTNAELLGFVRDGGYHDPRHWSAEGWAWRLRVGHEGPRFWDAEPSARGAVRYRAMFDLLPLPLGWPAEVNAHEAQAVCAWLGDGWRLPTEAEHARLAEGVPERHCDVVFGAREGLNLQLRYGSPSPVGACMAGLSRWGCRDVRGNVWQWLADDFRPLPGFRPHRLYEDFSVPYFDADHATLVGGAWASTGGTASRWYRLWFRRHFFQHAGFRPVRDAV